MRESLLTPTTFADLAPPAALSDLVPSAALSDLAPPAALADLVVPAAALTAALGLFVAVQAYRGYRRHDSATMLALAVGVVCLTAVPFAVQHVLAPVVGLTDARALLGVAVAYVVGLSAILHSLRR